jgi:hypothetical protein
VNSVEFVVYPGSADVSHDRLVVARIDGVDLRVMVAEAVTPLLLSEPDNEDLASDAEGALFVLNMHEGLPAADVAWPARHFLDEVDPYYNGYEPDEVPLLGCSCGLWGCWPLLSRISNDADTVTWTDFRQPFRKQWGRLPLGPFAFDRPAYLERLAAPTVVAADPLDIVRAQYRR